MRICVDDKASPYFDEAAACVWHVSVDGVELATVVEADDVAGWVRCITPSDAGFALGDTFDEFRLTGHVKLFKR